MTTDGTPLTRERLLQYFLDAAKPRERWLVGMEIERMGRDALSGAALPYDGQEPSIRAAIERYHELRGGHRVIEGPHVIGLNGDWGNVSLEPGGQFEWSSRPYPTLDELRVAAEEHEQTMERLAADLEIAWLDVATEPELSLDAMPWMPKARYEIMRPYLGARGTLGHRMMTQTAAIQVAFDYVDPRDWLRKFRAAALLAPLSTALFANSSRIDGEESGYACYRQQIWSDTDPERCGIPDVVFDADFDIERWLDWVLQVPTIFRHRARGRVPAEGVRFAELMRIEGCDALGMNDWESHVSTIFTEVRSYTYIEVRSADLQPRGRSIAVPTLWTGLLYDDDALDRALGLAMPFDGPRRWREAMTIASRDGLDGSIDGRSVREICGELLEIADRGLTLAACVDDVAAARATLTALREAREI